MDKTRELKIVESDPTGRSVKESDMNNFDRIGDWEKFNQHMKKYIEIPAKKYGSEFKFNDLCHYTGLRISTWNILKYALRLWSGCGKEHDFEKIAHYSQMAWTLKEQQGRVAPFFNDDVEGDYVVVRKNSSNGIDIKRKEVNYPLP